jgi:SPP1 gp7 family putative phage head morphogenesis protein
VLSTEQKAELWHKNNNFAISKEDEFGELAEDAFEEDYKSTSAIVTEQDKLARENRSSLQWPVVMTAIAGYLAVNSLEQWTAKFSQPLYNLMNGRVTELNKQFDQTYPTADLLKQQWFENYKIKFAQPINETTEKTIQAMIEQAVDEGWSMPTMQKNLLQVFDQWMNGKLTPEDFEWFKERMPEYRRELIARTETLRASNTVSHELYKAWGAPNKEWLATMDNRVRPDHADVNGQVVPIDQPFTVGGYSMMHPHDPTAPADQVCNCRCSEAPAW